MSTNGSTDPAQPYPDHNLQPVYLGPLKDLQYLGVGEMQQTEHLFVFRFPKRIALQRAFFDSWRKEIEERGPPLVLWARFQPNGGAEGAMKVIVTYLAAQGLRLVRYGK